MRVKDKTILHSSNQDMNDLKQFIVKAEGHSFDEIRASIQGWDAKTDGEIQQVALDAGLEVEQG